MGQFIFDQFNEIWSVWSYLISSMRFVRSSQIWSF